MIPQSFNDGWGVRPRTPTFFGFGGGPYQSVRLPHDALISLERSADAAGGANTGFFPGGDVEYEKRFEVPEDAVQRRLTLEFEGVYRDARVFVNGALAAHRPYGYSRFFVKLDPFLRYGSTNVVRVEAIADQDSRWYSGLGIYRPVTLHESGLVHVAAEGPRFCTPNVDRDLAVVRVEARVMNESTRTRTVRVLTEIVDDITDDVVATSSAPLTLFAGEEVTVDRRLFVRNPELWSPDSPTLYRGRVRLEEQGRTLDESGDTFGIRRLELDPVHGLRINGTPVKLRGACVHHDNGPIGAATIGAAEERRMRLLKEAGFNAIRSAHNPASVAMLRACDRLGMLVMDETFDAWTVRKARYDYAQSFSDWWKRDLESLVTKDFNRPSVILYSIGNEIFETGSELTAGLGRQLAATVRALDDTRFTVNSVNAILSVSDETAAASVMAERNLGVNDLLGSMSDLVTAIWESDKVAEMTEQNFAQVDVAGYNYGEARYALDADRFPDRIIVGSETSRADIAGNWMAIVDSRNVIGDFCWTGWDYLGEAGVGRVREKSEGGGFASFLGSYPYLAAEVGDLDITGTRRPFSYFRETVFGLRGAPYISVLPPSRFGIESAPNAFAGDWGENCWTWPGEEGKPTEVFVYSSADEVELLLDGRTLGRAAAGRSVGYVARFSATYQPGRLTAIAYGDGQETGRAELSTAGRVVALQLSAEAENIGSTDDDLAFVRISLADAAGLVNPADVRAVTVEVEGQGILQGLGSGDPAPEEPLAGDRRSTFRGSVLAVIRPTGPGSIRVTASTEGLPTASAEITVLELESAADREPELEFAPSSGS